MVLETDRLVLRELTMDDVGALAEILMDAESMKHYPKSFGLEDVRDWIQRNLDRYDKDGFGLWAVVLKEENIVIGDCGITMQKINGMMVPEIGYHVNRKYTKKGYATEAARACRDYAFDVLGMEKIYSYMKYTNLESARVAEKNGMTLEETYEDPVHELIKVYSITQGMLEQVEVSNG